MYNLARCFCRLKNSQNILTWPARLHCVGCECRPPEASIHCVFQPSPVTGQTSPSILSQPKNSFTPMIRRSGPGLFYIRSVGVHMLGLVSSFDSVHAGSCQGCAGQDEDGGEWGKVKCQLLPCQMFSHLNHLAAEHHHCVFASLPVCSSWSRWEGNAPAERDKRGERRLGWNTVMSTLAANTTSVLHPPSSMQTAWAKHFRQSINDHCQLGRAAVICNKSRNKKFVTEVKANFKIFSFAKKEIRGFFFFCT